MNGIRKNVCFVHDKAFDELYYLNTLVKMTKSSCQDREFRGEYFGMDCEGIKKLSSERNDYINMLNLMSDKLSNLININLSIENEILHE
jgi:hypothetical protein